MRLNLTFEVSYHVDVVRAFTLFRRSLRLLCAHPWANPHSCFEGLADTKDVIIEDPKSRQ